MKTPLLSLYVIPNVIFLKLDLQDTYVLVGVGSGKTNLRIEYI